MQVLHILWFGMFIRMGINLIVKGERKDIITELKEEAAPSDSKKVQ